MIRIISSKPVRLLLLAGLLLTAGCAGSRRTADDETPGGTQTISQEDLARAEDFDATPYSDAPPAEPVAVEHDVPAELMSGKATPAARRTGRGFRIQVMSTPSKQVADAQVNSISEWWRAEQGKSLPGLFDASQPPVYTAYRQPYYRIRIGNFATRAQAQRALSNIGSRFPGALIVPDTIVR